MTSARDLTARLADLLRREHAALADFLVALAEFDAAAAMGRARPLLALLLPPPRARPLQGRRVLPEDGRRAHPEVPRGVEPLRDGRLCLTSVVELAKVITPENRSEVLPRFFQLSKREAMAVSAELRPGRGRAAPGGGDRGAAPSVGLPRPALPPRFARERALPVRSRSAARSVQPDEPAARPVERRRRPQAAARPRPRPAPGTSRRGRAAHRRPAPAPRHRLPPLPREARGGTRRALALAPGRERARRSSRPGSTSSSSGTRSGGALVEKPRREPPPAKPDHVPAHVKRAVWKRDGGRCQWPLDGGGVCGSTHQVQFDHVVPRAGRAFDRRERPAAAHVHNDLAARQGLRRRLDGPVHARAGTGIEPVTS